MMVPRVKLVTFVGQVASTTILSRATGKFMS